MRRDRIGYLLSSYKNAWYLAGMIVTSIVFSMIALTISMRTRHVTSAYDLLYFVGPTVRSVLSGRGLLVCTEAMGTPGNPICFQSSRMPIATMTIAEGVRLFGDHLYKIALFKSLLFLIPLWSVYALALRALPRKLSSSLFFVALLSAPLFMLNYLHLVVNLETEEGYLFGLVALALALLLFPLPQSIGSVLLISITLDLLFFTKSSMLLAVLVLACLFMIRLRSPLYKIVLACLVLTAPVSWALIQHHVSGRFSVGTSLDGINFHKGNNSGFLAHYPPRFNNLDQYDWQLNQGHYSGSEWSFNDFHMQAAESFIRSQPKLTLRAAEEKFAVMLLSLKQYGTTSYGSKIEFITTLGMILFRGLLWTAIGISAYSLSSRLGVGRFNGAAFLAFIAAYLAPYIVGFGLTRHAVMLAYPATLLCLRALSNRDKIAEATMHSVFKRRQTLEELQRF